MGKIKTLFCLLCSLGWAATLSAYDLEGELQALDNALKRSSDYESKKIELISSLEGMASSPNIDALQRVNLLSMLYEEYFTYSFPRANSTLDRMQHLLKDRNMAIGRGNLINDLKISRIKLLSAAGLFREAQEIMENQMNPEELSPEQRQKFYAIAKKSYWGYREFLENVIDKDAVQKKIDHYSACLADETPGNSPEFTEMCFVELLAEHKYEQVRHICDSLLQNCGMGHIYGVISYYKAVSYEYDGKADDAAHWYVESAINDIKCAVKENASLYSLAKILLQRGDVERAFRYTTVAHRDALTYGSRLRPFQIIQSFPEIQDAYERQMEKRDRLTSLFIVLMSVLATLFFGTAMYLIVFVRRQHKDHEQIRLMGEKLQTMVQRLSEANAAKEEYLGLFLVMSSDYLYKLKKHLPMEQMDKELKSFYATFDQAFLHLYPNFVTDFNRLLKPEGQIEIKKQEFLNTELRIYALIRLGITQSSHIASLLRYSVNTIYNYRAQIKKYAIGDPDNFEEQVKNL